MSGISRICAAIALTALVATPHAAMAADKWVTPGFASGWTNFGKGYRAVSAVKSGNVVTVSGLAAGGKLGHVATLPSDMRPKQRLVFNVNTHDRTARVDVLANGQIHFVAGNTAHGWVSLDGISFSLGNSTALTLTPGWTNFGQGYAGINMVHVGDTVMVGGLVKPGKGDVIATLPAHLRPAKRLIFNLNSHDKTSRVDVFPDGRIIWVYRAAARGWVSLNGVTFDRKPGAPLKLVNGWKNHRDSSFAPASVTRDGNLVSVSGLTEGGTWGHIATLPNGMCPESRLIFNLNNHDDTGRVDVLADCRIVWAGGGKKHGWINLDGIAFNIGKPAGAQVAAKPQPPVAAVALPWVRVPGGATDIGVGANGAVWVVGENKNSTGNDIWRYAGNNKWQSIPGGAVRIAVDPTGNAWIVDKNSEIHHWDGGKWQTVAGGANDVAVGANGAVWVIGADKRSGGFTIWRYSGNNKWKNVPGAGKRIAVDPKGNAWIVNVQNQIFRYDGSKWNAVAGAATDIGIGADGTVWVTGTDSAPYRWDGKTWVKHVGGIANISIGPKGYPWATNAGKAIWADKRSAGYVKVPKPAPDPGGAGIQSSGVQTELRKNPAFAGASLTDVQQSNGALTANVKVGSVTAKLVAWRSAPNKPYVSAVVVPEMSVGQLLPKLKSGNKLSGYKLKDVVVFTVPSGAQNLTNKISHFPKDVADAVKKADPAVKDSDEFPLAPGMAYVGGLHTTGWLKKATDLMGLNQPVSLNGSLALTGYTAPQNTVTLTARLKQDPLALITQSVPVKVVTDAKPAKPELFLTATGTTEFEVGYKSTFEVFDQELDGKLSFLKSGTGTNAATSIAIEMKKDGEWSEPNLLLPRVKVRNVTLKDTVITFARDIDKAGSSDSLSVTTYSTKIHSKTYKPASFSFTIDSTSAYPKAAYVNLATGSLSVRQMAELAEVASQMSPQGQIAALAIGASPYSPGQLKNVLKLDQLPIDLIEVKNPKIYFATAGAKVPTFNPAIYPPLPEIFGAGIHVRGKLWAFGKELAKSEFQLDFKGLKTDTALAALPFGGLTLNDPRFKLNAAPTKLPEASFSGKTTIAGITIASTKISISANKFSYDLQSGCIVAGKISANGSTTGFQFSIPKPYVEGCVIGPLGDALDAAKNAYNTTVKLMSSYSPQQFSDATYGVGRDAVDFLKNNGASEAVRDKFDDAWEKGSSTGKKILNKAKFW